MYDIDPDGDFLAASAEECIALMTEALRQAKESIVINGEAWIDRINQVDAP